MKKSRTFLQNDTLVIAIDRHGAELKSIMGRETGDEYLWQADPAFWGRSAPILFPIVGMLKDNHYMVEGLSYSLPQHGFARDSEFERVDCGETSATFALEENEGTTKKYPYSFRLEATFDLESNRIVVSYKVSNTDEKTMLFSIGSHPAFRIPFGAGVLEDHFIEFEEEEQVDAGLPEDGLQSDRRIDPFESGRIIRLHRTLFNEGAFIFKQLQSQFIAIKSTKSDKQVVIETGGAPYLGIWSKPDGAPFVCIEPWFGIADSADSNNDFARKEGIISLEPGAEFNAHYTIQIF